MRFIKVFSRHGVLAVLVIWSVLPFAWAIQTSIKFTRDVAQREPVLWGYETTSSAYNKFWLDDDEINMYHVLWFILAAVAIAAVLGLVGRWISRGRPSRVKELVGLALLAAISIATFRALWIWIRERDQFSLWESEGGFATTLGVIATIVFGVVLPILFVVFGFVQRHQGWPYFVSVAVVLGIGLWWFPRVFEVEDEYWFFINSIIVTVLTMLISISIGLLAGYALARYSGISGAVILIIALAFRALPRTAFVLPYYFAAQKLGILDSRLVIVMALVAVNQPFTIWMFRTFFMDVPKEMEEAAMMDGATRFEAFRKVIVPIMWPGIIATSLFTLLLAYNEYLFVRVLAPTNWTLPVAIVSLTGGESSRTVTEAAAASVSITLPIIIVIILFQKHLVKGLGAGAVKG